MQHKVNVNNYIRRLINKGKQVLSKNELNIENANPGDLVEIYYGNSLLSIGVINPKDEKNYIRILSYDKDIENSIYEKIKKAKDYREKILNYKNHYRLIYSEGDLLSGLIIDKYNDIFVINNSNIFFDKNMNLIKNILIELYGDNITIYEKSIGKQRERSGLIPIERFIYNENYKTIIEENRKYFLVDILKGQKTGFFLDLREIRSYINKLSFNRVLDVFSYTGSLGINVKSDKIYFVEKDKKIIDILEYNIKRNNINNYKIINKNAYHALNELYNQKEKFDFIILDPPDLLAEGYKIGIKNFIIINAMAIDLIDDGYLLSLSCSQDLTEDKMFSILRTLIRRKKKKFEIINKFHQASDHKILYPHFELYYLKGYLLHIFK